MTSIHAKIVVTFICSLLILLFVYTALSKLWTYHQFEVQLYRSPLIENKAAVVAPMLILIELLTATLLLIPRTQLTGLWFSVALMTGFTIYVSYMLLFVPHLPCSCGGIISSLSWGQHLIVNILFTLIAAAGIAIKNEIFIRINRTSRTPVR